jgi:bifunctional DNA-binding transcriptional regulator/antitoxin component of YhaV-PrlF toxin-antitoxin module
MSGKILIYEATKFRGECLERKITLNKNNSGIVNGNLRIPMKLLESIGINERNRVVAINLDNDKLAVKKLKNMREDWVEVTPEERKYLLMYKSRDTLAQYIKKKIHDLFLGRIL